MMSLRGFVGLFKTVFLVVQALGELKWLGIFRYVHDRRSKVIVLFFLFQKTWTLLEEKSIPWIFGYCWPPISVLRTLWIFPWFVRMPGLSLALLPFGPGCTEGATTETHSVICVADFIAVCDLELLPGWWPLFLFSTPCMGMNLALDSLSPSLI